MTKTPTTVNKTAAYHLTARWRWGTSPMAPVTVTAVYLCAECRQRLPTVLWLLQPAAHAFLIAHDLRPANSLERRELHCCVCAAIAMLPDEFAYSDELAAEAERSFKEHKRDKRETLFDAVEIAAMEAAYRLEVLETLEGWRILDVDDLRREAFEEPA
ncbi:hypothetical protein HRbin17_00521 [bacterium HR17]|jgi:hypothetical protein|uniref:Uncharacterized protein n=1 Tax=Candidatus Fervidibacter japonicus TaxID=2035412 RepID=A0A2H5XA01_9BACT|nr:hypothetical protein HRbin17_00521 [bacterium HR17]